MATIGFVIALSLALLTSALIAWAVYRYRADKLVPIPVETRQTRKTPHPRHRP